MAMVFAPDAPIVVARFKFPPKRTILPSFVIAFSATIPREATESIVILRKIPVAASCVIKLSVIAAVCKPVIAIVFAPDAPIVVARFKFPPKRTILPSFVIAFSATIPREATESIVILRTTPVAKSTVKRLSVCAAVCKPTNFKGSAAASTVNLLVGAFVPIPTSPVAAIRIRSTLFVMIGKA